MKIDDVFGVKYLPSLLVVVVILVGGSIYAFYGQFKFTNKGSAAEAIQEKLDHFSYGKYQDVAKCLNDLKDEARRDPTLLLEHLTYPFQLYESGQVVRSFSNLAEAKASEDMILTQDVISSLLDQDPNDLFVSYQGIMIGDGNIWFEMNHEGSAHIVAINP